MRTFGTIISDIDKLVSDIHSARNEVDNHLLQIDIQSRNILDAEMKMAKLMHEGKEEWSHFVETHIWHPAEEKPNHTDGWFLAVCKDGQPFLTHYIGGWVSQVYMWQYIVIPV